MVNVAVRQGSGAPWDGEMFSRTILSHLRASPLAGRRQHQHQQELHFSWPQKKKGYKCLDTLRTTLTQGEDRTVLDRPNERYHAYRTTQSRRPRPEPAPDLLARSPDSMRQDFSLGGSFKIFGTTILSPFQCIRNTPTYCMRPSELPCLPTVSYTHLRAHET